MQTSPSTIAVIATLLACLVGGFRPVVAAEKPRHGTTIVAEGAGLSTEEALKNAFQNAVRQVVGSYLDAETLIENDRMVSQRILTYSNGFISSYRVLEDTYEDAIFRTRIAAVVERGPLVKRLSENNLIVQDLDGGALVAEALTRQEAEHSAAELLENTFEGFPGNVLRAELLGRPSVSERNERMVQLRYVVRLSVDPKLYSTFQRRLVIVLNQVATHNGSITAKSVAVPKKYHAHGNDFFQHEFLASSQNSRVKAPAPRFRQFRSIVATTSSGSHPGANELTTTDGTPLLFVVQSGSGSAGRETTWRWFETSCPYHVAAQTLQVQVELVDDAGKEIGQDAFLVGPRTPALSIDDRPSRDGSPHKVVISPYVLFHSGTGYGAKIVTYARDMTLQRQVSFSRSQLANVEQVKCQVTVMNR